MVNGYVIVAAETGRPHQFNIDFHYNPVPSSELGAIHVERSINRRKDSLKVAQLYHAVVARIHGEYTVQLSLQLVASCEGARN